MASTFGTQPTFNGADWTGVTTQPYQRAQFVSTWPGGTIQEFHMYCSGFNAAQLVYFCIWDSAGTLLWNSGGTTIAQGTTAVGGQAWQVITGLSVTLAAASGLYLGLGRTGTSGAIVGRDGNGTYTTGTGVGAAALTGTASSVGTLGTYVVYIQGGVKDYQGAFNKYKSKAYVAGAWQWSPIRTYNTTQTNAWTRNA